MRELLGFHGTSFDKARQIIESEKFILETTRKDHWLGQGAYFFYEDYEQAKLWAINRYSRKRFAIVEANLAAPREKILDLHTRAGVDYLYGFVEYLLKEEGIEIRHDKFEASPEIACFVFSLIPTEDKWLILKSFSIASKKFESSGILEELTFVHNGKTNDFLLQSPQICVRNQKAIKTMCICDKCEEYTNYRINIKKESVSNDLFNWS